MRSGPRRAPAGGPRWFAVAAVVPAVLALAGCGSDNSASTESSTPATTTTVTRTAEATTGVPPTEPTTDPFAGSPLIDHTEWTDDPDGRRLHVYPTAAGRADQFPAALDRAWSEVLADSPDADSPGMYDQFRCHWVWARMVAPNKPSWNLEPWRPAVGYEATVQAMCNPGGPDPAGN
ncbi:DUF2599 domain-containing protein [Nocardia africana]|uniref:Protein of uncharacterized function (DUF2599) n=2 Tax=Nocardia africana TaxID=134964 RepID=A0A378WYI8_9NOCA|nr:DUF2599 domain-containing protein [Nocardia africana]SUA45383.1 Protein of uncharacterised function (DUF2599) [Nocardia africana]